MIYEMGMRLKIERIRKKLTQKEVAERVGVKEPSITSYESGGTTPPGEVLIKLATVYDVTTDYLLGVNNQKVKVLDGLSDEQISAVDAVISQFKKDNEMISGGKCQ